MALFRPTMILPILVALKRHKAGTLLIALQIALTLAIVCNALFIVQQRIEHQSRPSGVDEGDLLTVESRWVGVSGQAIVPLIQTDLAALRQLPGVQAVAVSYGYPLRGGGWTSTVSLVPNTRSPVTETARFFVDDHALAALGAKLIAGRNFHSEEIHVMDSSSLSSSAQIIITKALAERLYPDGSALGKSIYIGGGSTPSTVVGIIDRLQGPFADSESDATMDNVALEPVLLTDKSNAYLIRTEPGQLARLSKAVPAVLRQTYRMRVLPNDRGVRSFAEVRADAYKRDRGLALVMGAVCVLLLAITAAGIVGLTSFWVGQRRKQIGVRRALGATRGDILGYFLTENFLISLSGVVLGTLLALGLSLWLVTHFEMQRLSLPYLLAGMVVLLLLGQAATLAPALRASRVPPVEATRSV